MLAASVRYKNLKGELASENHDGKSGNSNNKAGIMALATATVAVWLIYDGNGGRDAEQDACNPAISFTGRCPVWAGRVTRKAGFSEITRAVCYSVSDVARGSSLLRSLSVPLMVSTRVSSAAVILSAKLGGCGFRRFGLYGAILNFFFAACLRPPLAAVDFFLRLAAVFLRVFLAIQTPSPGRLAATTICGASILRQGLRKCGRRSPAPVRLDRRAQFL
jgi:hypothetical protein